MRLSLFARLSSIVLVSVAITTTVEGTPYLPADIRVGATVTGLFSFPITGNPPDQDPDPIRGRYTVDSTARMVTSVGATEFSTNLTGMTVQVIDQSADADWNQLFGSGDETTFAPFLSNFARQHRLLEPQGVIGLNFRFPHTHLSSDAFPTSIDPLATVPPPSGHPTSGIHGWVEGLSMQRPNAGTREWAFFYIIDPLDLSIAASAGVLNGTFVGTIYHVDDRAVVRPPGAPVPEPASVVLFMTGLIGLHKLVRRSKASSMRAH